MQFIFEWGTTIHYVGAKCFCKIFSPHATCMVASLIYTCEVSQLNIPYTCKYVCKRVEQKKFILIDEVREMLSFQGEGFTKQSKCLNKTYKVPSLDLQNKRYKVPNVRQSVCWFHPTLRHGLAVYRRQLRACQHELQRIWQRQINHDFSIKMRCSNTWIRDVFLTVFACFRF